MVIAVRGKQLDFGVGARRGAVRPPPSPGSPCPHGGTAARPRWRTAATLPPAQSAGLLNPSTFNNNE